MSCCGNRRAEARRALTTFVPMTVNSSRSTDAETIPIRYVHEGRIAVRGGVTGTLYQFSGVASTPVAASDARVLVASGRFAATE
jgi:hypothetical protein